MEGRSECMMHTSGSQEGSSVGMQARALLELPPLPGCLLLPPLAAYGGPSSFPALRLQLLHPLHHGFQQQPLLLALLLLLLLLLVAS